MFNPFSCWARGDGRCDAVPPYAIRSAASFADRIPKRRMIAAAAISQAATATTESGFDRGGGYGLRTTSL